MSSATSRLMPTLRRVVLAGAAADRTDGQLLGAFVADRDADAFAGLVRRHGPMVLGVCRRVTGDHTTADDAFQAVFIVLARRAGAVKPREQVGNWLYGVAYRTALKARAVLARRRSREKQVDVMPEPHLTDAALAEWADLQPVIDEELARLPDKLRLPVVLCDLEGRAQRDVAKQLAIPPATLATRLATARRTLASRLTKRGVTLSGGALAGLLSVHGTATAVPYSLAHGVTRAAEALAGGNLVSALVSAHAVQLSEGVMRMMLLSKLKAVAVTALTALALSGGLGLGLMPAYASGTGDDPAQAQGEKAAKPAAPATDKKLDPNADMDDATFLRRLTLDFRGTLPTDVETFFFLADADVDKREKVTVWLTDDGDVIAFVAKRLGVPAERVRLVRATDGKTARLVAVLEAEPKIVSSVALSPDGTKLAVDVTATVTEAVDPTVKLAVVDNAAPLLTQYRRTRIAAQPPAKVEPANPASGFFRLFANPQTAEPNDALWLFTPQDDTKTNEARLRYWIQDSAKGTWVVADDKPNVLWTDYLSNTAFISESDIDFLKRVIKDARGTAPTALEEKYFAEDKDPKKREKLLDTLLKDAAVAKKLGDDWKKKMLATTGSEKTRTFEYQVVPKLEWQRFAVPLEQKNLKLEFAQPKEGFRYVVPLDPKVEGQWRFTVPTPATPVTPKTPPTPVTPKAPAAPKAPSAPKPPAAVKPPAPAAPKADKFEKLVGELLAVKKSDADMVEAVSLAVLGRLPTDAEKKLTLGFVAKAADRKAAWIEVAKALAGTNEGKQRSDAVELKGTITEAAIELHVVPTIVPIKP